MNETMSTLSSLYRPLHISMTRTIHPVGQGAFYSEAFINEVSRDSFTAVYDCGGKVDAVKREIERLQRVDILFISHFHDDHVNMVQYLIKNKSVCRVVFPRVSPCRFLVDYIRNSMKDKTGSAIHFMLKVLPIIKTGNEGLLNIPSNILYVPVKSGKQYNYPVKSDIWEYIAFYEENDSKEKELIGRLKPILGLPDECSSKYQSDYFYQNIADRLSVDPDVENKVKEEYAKTFHNRHNSYSMPVLSHQLVSDASAKKEFDCLYTGDVDVRKWVLNIESKYKPDYIQVPHHGSNHNHNIALYGSGPEVFISVGLTNRYRHPGLKALLELQDKCKDVHVVTEDSFRVFQKSALL